MTRINIRHHFILEAIQRVNIKVIYIPMDEAHVDLLTKVLPLLKSVRFTYELWKWYEAHEGQLKGSVGTRRSHSRNLIFRIFAFLKWCILPFI